MHPTYFLIIAYSDVRCFMEVTIVYNCNLCEFAPISLALNQNVLYEMAETT